MTEPPASWSSPGDWQAAPPPVEGYPPPAYGQAPAGWPAAPPQPGVIPLRPLALGEILDGALKVIRRYPRPTLGLSAGIALVVTLLNVLVTLTWHRKLFGPDNNSTFTTSQFGDAASGGVAQLIAFLASLVLTGALIAVVGRAVRGQTAATADVWATVRPRLWALLGLSLLTGILVAGPMVVGIGLAILMAVALDPGSLLLGIPLGIAGVVLSVYLYSRLSLAPAALVLEKASVTQALKRSGVLVRGSWWRIFGILLLTGLIVGIVEAIIGFPLGIVTYLVLGGLNSTPALVAQQVAAGLTSVLIAPFSAGVRALLYVDRRMRAEGLDVALQSAVSKG